MKWKDRFKLNNNNNEVFTKRCAMCGEYFRTKHITKAYCKECYAIYKKKWDTDNEEHNIEYREEKKSNYIYMFIPTEPQYPSEVLNIGSTTDIAVRMSAHLTVKTVASKKITKAKRKYNIVYAEIEDKLLDNRDELYFIEYYLIHKYYVMFGVNPIGNDRDTFEHDICTSRQFELILIAEQLKYEQYDIFRHKKILL